MVSLAAAFSTIDSHTAGHPTRVILSGVPALKGNSVRARRDDFRARFDHLRSALLHEPRGHAAMVGAVQVPSEVADFGVFFISSYVYLDMCGHGTIGFAKTLAFTGAITSESGDTFTLETPAGVVTVGLSWADDGTLSSVRLRNVPSYVGIDSVKVDVEDVGPVDAPIVYGGMWYALVDADALGLELAPANASSLMRAGWAIKSALSKALIGSEVIGDAAMPSVLFYSASAPDDATHFLVLASNKFDRSPCGTGSAARMCWLLETGQLAPEKAYTARNILGIPFTLRLAGTQPVGERSASIVEIEGSAFITSTQTILFESDDPLSRGFLCN
ncbi:MAG: proline racemase [Rhizobiales bacterium]|nr:proline racemase [Hyphomicrobiales bacterium]MBA68294.1 proline racemase [Hyphomicrobiales bacterium]